MSSPRSALEAVFVSRVIKFFSLFALSAVAAVLVACGGGGGEAVSADEDPQAVLERAFSDESAVNSAKIDAKMTIDVEGEEAGKVELGVNGAVENAGEEAPDTDLNVSIDGDIDGEKIEFEAGAVLTAEAGFVRLEGETYQIDPGMYEQVRGQIAQQTGDAEADEDSTNGGLFGSLDAQAFLTDVSNEGTEDVEGVETVKISGTVDTDKALAEAESFLGSADTLQGLGMGAPGTEEFGEVKEALGNVDFSIYVGSDDGVIRKMEFEAPVNPPDSDNSGSFSVSITLADVNEPQDIKAPSDAKPFDELIAAIGEGALSGLGLDGFNDLGQLGGGSSPFDQLEGLFGGGSDSGKSGGNSGGTSADGAKSGGDANESAAELDQILEDASAEVDQALEGMPELEGAKEALDCIQKAKTVDEISACEELVK